MSNSETVKAEALTVGMRLDSGRKSRVAQVHIRNGRVLVRVETRGARSATVAAFNVGDDVRVWG
jgi:hypothetical protein